MTGPIVDTLSHLVEKSYKIVANLPTGDMSKLTGQSESMTLLATVSGTTSVLLGDHSTEAASITMLILAAKYPRLADYILETIDKELHDRLLELADAINQACEHMGVCGLG